MVHSGLDVAWTARPLWQQRKRANVARSYDAKMFSIGREDFTSLETLGDSNDRCVDETQWQIAISVHDVGDARKIVVLERLDRELAIGDRPHKCLLSNRSDSRLKEVCHLSENRDRQDDVRDRAPPPRVDARMPAVARVDERVDRTRIGDDGQPCGSRHSSSSTRSDVSLAPLANRPAIDGTPDAGSTSAAYCASASRTTVAKLTPRARASFCIRLMI